MTNEDLALLIKSGESDKTYLLYEQCRGFIFKQAVKWASAFSFRPDIELDDLLQSAFFAILEAADRFVPGKGTFLSVLALTLKTAFCEATGTRTIKQRNDPLYQKCSRFESPASEDPDSDLTVGDMIPDSSASEAFDQVEDEIANNQLFQLIKNALELLPEQQRIAIEGYYLKEKTQKEIAVILQVSDARAQQIIKDGLKALRYGKYVPDFAEVLYCDRNYYRKTNFHYWNQTGTSCPEAETIYRESIEEQFHLKTPEGKALYMKRILGLDPITANRIAYKT